MDPSFRQWLSARNAPPKLLKRLEKEDIVNATTLSAMTDSDLESLQRKHKLPMGHAVILRSGRDELRRGKKVPSPSRSEDSFEVLASPVQREAPQGSATAPLLSPPPSYPARHGGETHRPRGEEIRSKYRLPNRGVRAPPRNGASAMPHSATPSPLPDTARTPTPAGGAGRLQAAAQMQDLHKRGVERGEKIAVIEEKSRDLASAAMDYESICAQLADKKGHGKKKKKKQKKKNEPPSQEAVSTQHSKKALSNNSSPAHPQQQGLSSSTPHTLPHHPSHSPSHTPSATFPSSGPQSDPIRHRSPHTVPTYGTMDEDRSRPTTPTTFSYTSDDEKLHLHYDEEEGERGRKREHSVSGRRRCSCCSVM